MRIFFDCEFEEDGRTIELISIGMVRQDGLTLYRESADYNRNEAPLWIRENVLPHLGFVSKGEVSSKAQIAYDIVEFVGRNPEFWAYYADYDWVCLCQLYGKMIDLPDSWPMYCRDIKQLCDSLGNPRLPPTGKGEHHALVDAQWNFMAYQFLKRLDADGESA